MLSEQREFDTPPPPSGRLGLWILAWLLIGLAVVVVVSRQFGGRPTRESPAPPHPAIGKKLERLSLEPLTGTTAPLALDDLTGKVALINIWGTWCGPCVIEFPHLKELAEHYQNEPDFRLVSISCTGPGGDDEELADNTSRFLREQRADFPTYSDPQWTTRNEIARVTNERGVPYPTTVIVGRDGTIQALWFGYADGLTAEMRRVIDTALQAKKSE
jgi:thiol-disulfide isomerase/thioredoxin